MRKIATLAILLILFVGFVGAVMPAPTYNFGPESGIKVKALEVARDAQIKGNLYTNGTSVVDGVVSDDMRMGAGYDFISTTGSGVFGWNMATGFFNTSTGTNYINGNVIQATLKNYTMQGASTFTSGTGAFDINGALTTKGITQDSGSSLAQSGASGITVGTTGITASASPLKLLENVTVSANKNIVTSGTGTITSAATITGEQLTSTDDALVVDDLVVDGSARIDETATVNALVSNTTIVSTGTSTASTFLGNVKIPDFFSIGSGRIVDTNYTYPAGGKMDSIVKVDCRSYNSTITLLPAASAPGNLTIVKLQYAPGAYFTRINVTSNAHINGKDLVYTTDDSSTFLPSISLWSDGTTWYVINAYGTWASADV